ncbi:MAG: molybdopterin converting factor subunit 1 [Gemmatimonadota bacterium]
MLVTVLLFARAREVAAAREVQLELGDGARVRDLREQLCDRFPGLQALAASLSVAVNREYATDATFVRPGDEVAVIPPVSGGSPPGRTPAAARIG